MHKPTCEEMVEITKAVVATGLPFTMWGDSYNGNIGINIKIGNKMVDICQYMSPIDEEEHGHIKTIPIALSIAYSADGRCDYDEGSGVDDTIKKIKEFFGKEVKIL